MAADVATGLAYLESLSYVHKDIAARSCMVTQSLGVKIAGKEMKFVLLNGVLYSLD